MQAALLPLLEDFLSAIVFVVVYGLTKQLVLATSLAIAVGLGQFAFGVIKRRPFTIMRWIALALAVGLGSMTLLTNNSHYIQLKPTIAHLVIGATMLKRAWLLRYLPPIAKTWLPEAAVVGWGHAWAALMLATAVANAIAAQWLSVPAWGACLIGLWMLKGVFGTAQYFSMRQQVVRRMTEAAATARNAASAT